MTIQSETDLMRAHAKTSDLRQALSRPLMSGRPDSPQEQANLSQKARIEYNDAGVPEPGLNSGSMPLGKGGGLKWIS